MRGQLKGFSAMEMMLVVFIISTLTVIMFWPKKEVYRMSREVLLNEFVATLNQNIELYKVSAFESDLQPEIRFSSKEEALEALKDGLAGSAAFITKVDLPKHIDHFTWDSKEQKFSVKTNNNTRENNEKKPKKKK